jgi:hypothetical protein
MTGSVWAELPLARLWTIFPPGGQAGSKVEVTLTGADLDQATQMIFSHTNIAASLNTADKPGEAERHKFMVAIGKDVPPGVYEARVVGRFGVSNPRAFGVSVLPEIARAEVKSAEEAAKTAEQAAKDVEDRSFTAYSGVLTLKVTPSPASTAATAKASDP